MSTSSERRGLRFRVSGVVKRAVLGFYGIPLSRHGIDSGLVPFLREGVPVTLIDVGASSGAFTAAVHAHCGVTRALLAEPQPARCHALRARFSDARFAIHNCAVSNLAGTTEMDILNFDYSSSLLPVMAGVGGAGDRLDLTVKERITVLTRTLDELVRESALDGTIDLLKIDTQGTELDVLQGASAVLARVRMVWTEISFRAMYEGSALFADVHAQLSRHGFRLYSIHDGFRGADGELLQGDALFLSSAVRTPVP